MAIVKMSSFELVIKNEHLDSLLLAFQQYENIVFKKDTTESAIFKPYHSLYNMEDNIQKREHIQEILKRLAIIKKKDSSKVSVKSLGLQTMTLQTADQLSKENDLDTILSFYSEHYDQTYDRVGSFKFDATKKISEFSESVLQRMADEKALICVLKPENLDAFLKEIKRMDDAIILYQPALPDKPSMVAIFTTPDFHETVSVLVKKHGGQKRSAASLHIEDKIKNLRTMIRGVLEKHHAIDDRIQAIGYYQDVLKAHYERLANEALREETKKNFIQSNRLTILKGWIFTEAIDAFEDTIQSVCDVYDLHIADAPKHALDVPIKLRNNRFVSAFEMITNMYSYPRYDEPDPTPLFSLFYAIFFGMMLADLGYGMLMFLVMFLVLKTVELKTGTKNMVRMLFYVSIPTMIWGIIYGSFFGGLVPMKPLIDINKDFNTVLVMALSFGIIHLFTGLAIKAWIYIRDYKLRYVIYDVVFWYMTLLGAIALVSQIFTNLLTPYNAISIPLMVSGMLGIVLTNGRDAKTLGGKLAAGLYSLYGITNYVGDIVSYSRLMALGLAGASIGVAFNMMIDMVSGMGVLSVILGAIIFIIGHSFNLLISGLSSYVHAARLTYVEFFGKFFVGGGKAFKPFIAQATYLKIGKES